MTPQQSQTLDDSFNKVLKNITPQSAYITPADYVVFQLVRMTLCSIKEGNHPVLNPADFKTNHSVLPNITIKNPKTSEYVGARFPGNASVALDLFSITRGLTSRNFVSIDELKNMGLDDRVKISDKIKIVLKSEWTDKVEGQNAHWVRANHLEVVNVESLLYDPRKNPSGLRPNKFNQYFPDFAKQQAMSENYSKNAISQLKENLNAENFNSAKENIQIEIENSKLPRLTHELYNYERSRTLNIDYKPKYTQQEQMVDIVNLYKKNPRDLISAIQQSGYIMERSVKTLLSSKLDARINKTLDKSIEVEKQQTLSNTNTRKNSH